MALREARGEELRLAREAGDHQEATLLVHDLFLEDKRQSIPLHLFTEQQKDLRKLGPQGPDQPQAKRRKVLATAQIKRRTYVSSVHRQSSTRLSRHVTTGHATSVHYA